MKCFRDGKKKKNGIEFKILNKMTDKLTETAAEYIVNKVIFLVVFFGSKEESEKGGFLLIFTVALLLFLAFAGGSIPAVPII